jgi:vitamin B12/bleomycin/antimicrobial peptide transport system ATP-binding/permease protein
LLKDLSVEIPKRTRTLIAGSNPSSGRALIRATAGAQVSGSGPIIRPPADVAFLRQRSYAPPGSLREILLDGKPKPPTWSKKTNESKA